MNGGKYLGQSQWAVFLSRRTPRYLLSVTYMAPPGPIKQWKQMWRPKEFRLFLIVSLLVSKYGKIQRKEWIYYMCLGNLRWIYVCSGPASQSKVDRGQASLVKDLQELEGARLDLFGLEYLDSHLNISSAV